MPVADALAAVLSGAEALPEEMVVLDSAHKRILARDLAALRTQPPQAMSAMDGYAVRAADAVSPGARLKVIGATMAPGLSRLAGAGWPAYLGLLGFAAHCGWQVVSIDAADTGLSLALFRSNRLAGLILFAGLLADALLHARG